MTTEPYNSRRVVLAVRACLLTVLLLGVVLSASVLSLGTDQDFSAAAVEEMIRGWGPWGVFGSIGFMVLHSFVPFPAEFLAIVNGMVYGPFWGTVITWTGAMLGALLAFGLARLLGRPFVEIMVARKNWYLVDEWTAMRAGHIVLISRFIPVISFNLINYAAGMTRISWWTFGWATGIGILPLTILMVLMGDRFETLPWGIWLLLGVCGLALWFVLRHRLHPSRERGGAGRTAPALKSHVD